MKKKFTWWCDDINAIHKALNANYEDEYDAEDTIHDLDTCAVLEYPFVDIELTIRDYADGKLYYDYFCCVNKTGDEDGWESYSGVDFGEKDPKEFTTEIELMEDMNNQLIKFCKKHNLKMY